MSFREGKRSRRWRIAGMIGGAAALLLAVPALVCLASPMGRGHMMGGPMMGKGGHMMKGPMMGRHMMEGRGMPVHFMKRHMTYHMQGLPKQYAGASNLLKASAENIARGAALFREQCSSCHGPTGKGDGLAGKQLNPRPTNIAFTLTRPVTSDEFLLWTISEGGVKFGTAMPPFKDVLAKDDIWRIVLFMRDGFKASPAAGDQGK